MTALRTGGGKVPLYEFQCRDCGSIKERVFRLAALPQEITCEECGGTARQNIGCAILRDEPTWLPSTRKVLQDDNEKPIESRSEYKKYLKTNNIVERA
jgi:putative FmdB family regulatory protein